MFCPKCGKKLNDNDVFCAFCGETLNGSSNNTDFPSPFSDSLNAQPKQQAFQPVQNKNVPKRKKRSKLLPIIIIVVIVLAVVAAGIVLFVAPGLLLDKDGDDSGKSKKNKSSSVSETDGDDEDEEDDDDDDENSDEDDDEDEEAVTTEAETTTKAAKTKPASKTTTTAAETTAEETTETTSAADDDTAKKNAVYDEAMSLSTGQRPDYDEFEWCFGQDGLIYDAPAGAEIITEPLGYSGSWKAMVIYNPTNSAGTFIRELDNISIEVNIDSIAVTIDWYQMDIDGSESYNEEDMEDSLFLGSVTDTGIYASGDAEISINSLWEENGCQYALGTIITYDGLPAYLAMVRP